MTNGRFDSAWPVGWPAPTMFYVYGTIDAGECAALTNVATSARKAAYERIERAVSEQVPELPLWWPRQIQAIDPDFKNFTPNAVTETWNADTWDI